MTKLDSLMLSSFEQWAEVYWAEGLNCEFDEDEQRFGDNIVQDAWAAYREATRIILAGLGLGVEAHKHGAAATLMCKVKDNTLVLKSGFVAVGESGFGRAEL